MPGAPPAPEDDDIWRFVVRWVFHPWSSLDWITKAVVIGSLLTVVGPILFVYLEPVVKRRLRAKRGA